MRKKNYWKECCILLIGLILGCLYEKHFNSLPVSEPIVPVVDTIIIKDTIFIESTIPPLSKHSVLSELKKQNIPHANIVLAQSLLETGSYKSTLCKTHNNIFGIRKGNSYKQYKNYRECIADYKKRISSKYKGGDYYVFLERLGYAEDPLYTQKLKGIVRKS